MEYKGTLTSAREFANRGELEHWVHAYLLSEGNNKAFSEGLKLVDRTYLGPFKMPLSLFTRCCGPETTMKWRVDEEGFENRVFRLMQVINTENDLPPLIVQFVANGFELNDGNHRHEAYARLGIHEIHVIVWITDPHDYALFLAKYPEYVSSFNPAP
jgi:hypothetical protein